jgi:hypothetical protein
MTLRRRFERINRGVADPTARPRSALACRQGVGAHIGEGCCPPRRLAGRHPADKGDDAARETIWAAAQRDRWQRSHRRVRYQELLARTR